jgi:hypothetical protein
MSTSSWNRQDESNFLLDEPNSDPFSPPNGLDPLDPQSLLSSDEEDDDDEALSLPSAGVANVRGETPESDHEDVDIGEFDWGDADQEVNDFLAEIGDDENYTDDSDNERYLTLPPFKTENSVTSNSSERKTLKRKRKREGESSREISDADDSDTDSSNLEPRSRLVKRIQTAHSRKSHLSKSVVVSSKVSSAIPSPNGSSHGPSPANGSAIDKDSEGEDVEDSDLDDWANEFEKDLV